VKLSAFMIDQFEVTHELYTKAQLPILHIGKRARRNRSSGCGGAMPSNIATSVRLLEGFKPVTNEKTADWDCDYSANGYRLAD